MVRAYILIIIIYLIKFSVAANLSNTTKDVDHCFGKKCINKCCPIGEYPRKKTCTEHAGRVDFSGLIVYDENMRDTGRKVQDEFTILTGKLANEPLFQTNKAYVSGHVGYIPYVMESGVLTLEMPNVYRRWVYVPNNNFCIDYFVTNSGGLTIEPKFMILQSSDETTPRPSGKKVYLTAASLVSCVFLLLVLMVYILLPELQNLGGQILMSYVGSLFTAFIALAVMQLGVYELNGCITLTFMLYFSFLASFCWMSIMSYDIWWTFRGYAKARPIHRRGERFKFLMYCLCAWGVPLLMSIFVVVVTVTDMKRTPWFITPQIPKKGCFLTAEAELLYLYIPMLILIVCNWMFYLMTAFNIWRLSRGTAVLDTAAAGTPSAHRSQRHRLMVYVKLSVVMGLNWVFEIISYMWPSFSYVWHVTDFYNMFIGIAIFVIFVCKKKIYRKLYKRYASRGGKRYEPGSSKSYSSGSSSSGQETVELRVCANPKGNGYTTSVQ